MGFPAGSVSKKSACNAGDLGSIPELGGSPGKGTATHCSILAWRIPWPEFPQLHVFWERDETMPGQFFTLKFEGARGVRKVIK